jgi:cytochrome c553
VRPRRLALAWLAAASALAPAAAATDEAALERGRRIVSGRCFLCHGMQGESASELSPRLAGQNAAYIAKQLANFKSGERKSTAMRPMAADLSPDDMRAVALYYSRQRGEPQAPGDAALVASGKAIYERGGKATEVAACTGCHGERGHGSEALPRLAGQLPAYLATQLREFGARARTNDNAVMHTVAARMTAEEIDAVAAYLATLD